MITAGYLNKRTDQLLAHMSSVYRELGFDDVDEQVERVKRRLLSGEGKLYGPRAVHRLQLMKRMVRNEIKVAILTMPSRKKEISLLREEYDARLKSEREASPNAQFFSFESAYAKKLKVNMGQYGHLFRLSPKEGLVDAAKF